MSFWDDLAQVGGSVLQGVGGLVPGAGPLLQGLGTAWKASDNYFLQQDARQQAMDREDNAAQRRAADYQLAGINPQLAAGSVASSSAASMAPQGQEISPDQGAMGALRVSADIGQTLAQAELVKAQALKAQSETTGQDLANQLAEATNPLKKSQLELQVALDTAMNPTRIAMMQAQLKGQDISNVNAQLDTSLKQLGISDAQVKLAMDRFTNNNVLPSQLDNLQKEAMVKAATYDALTLSNQQLQEQTTMGAGVVKGVSGILGLIQQGAGVIKSMVPSIPGLGK